MSDVSWNRVVKEHGRRMRKKKKIQVLEDGRMSAWRTTVGRLTEKKGHEERVQHIQHTFRMVV